MSVMSLGRINSPAMHCGGEGKVQAETTVETFKPASPQNPCSPKEPLAWSMIVLPALSVGL